MRLLIRFAINRVLQYEGKNFLYYHHLMMLKICSLELQIILKICYDHKYMIDNFTNKKKCEKKYYLCSKIQSSNRRSTLFRKQIVRSSCQSQGTRQGQKFGQSRVLVLIKNSHQNKICEILSYIEHRLPYYLATQDHLNLSSKKYISPTELLYILFNY